MHETLCFSIQSASPNLDDLPLRCDGCETVSCVVGSCSDHVRIMGGSWSDRFRIVNGVSTVFRACVVDRIPLWFATVGSFPHCKWDASGAGGWVADGIALWFATLGSFPHCKWELQVVLVDELPMEFWRKSRTKMRFWEIADARNPMFFHTKCVPEPRWSTSAVRRVRDGLVCGRIMLGSCSDHGRIMVGSVSAL